MDGETLIDSWRQATVFTVHELERHFRRRIDAIGHAPQLVRQRHVSERCYRNQSLVARMPGIGVFFPRTDRPCKGLKLLREKMIETADCQPVFEVVDLPVAMVLELQAFNAAVADAMHDLENASY